MTAVDKSADHEDASSAGSMRRRDTDVHGGNPDRIVFLSAISGDATSRILRALGDATLLVRTCDDLKDAAGRILLSFGTSIMVSKEVLSKFNGAAYNIHSASPQYPGRDPHHWAVYEGVSRYGATMHVMTERVDDGPIVDVEWFDVILGTTPETLLARANEAAMRIIERVGPRLQRGETLKPLAGVSWSGVKRSRRDFLAMCEIPLDLSPAEFERRFHAFDGGYHDNLRITVHGRTFRIDKPRT